MRCFLRMVRERYALPREPAKPAEDLFRGACADRKKVPVASGAEQQGVGQDGACVRAEQAVKGGAFGLPGHVPGEDLLEESGGTRSGDLDTPEKADVEQPRSVPDRVVFFVDAGEEHGDLPFAEFAHLRFELEMVHMDRCLLHGSRSEGCMVSLAR